MPPRKKIDFGYYEPQYPRIFRMLRQAGWSERRDVDFTDVDEDADGKLRGFTVLHDAALSFLRSFFGLRITITKSYGESGFLIGFGPQWNLMQFERHHDAVQRVASEVAADEYPYPIITWDRCVAFLTWDQRVIAIDDNYQICIQAKDPFQLMEWILDRSSQPDVKLHYLEYRQMPYEYWHLASETHPLEFHLRQYRPYQLTEGELVTYVLESVVTKVVALQVLELREENEQMFVSYRKHAHLTDELARQLIVHKLLDEWLEGRYRQSTKRIAFENLDNQQSAIIEWPSRLNSRPPA